MWYIYLPIGLIVGGVAIFCLMYFLPSSKVKSINEKVENITKTVTTVATLTGSALMIYNNLNKAHDILGTVKRNAPYVPKKKK